MDFIGIVSEYNPFHQGHAYQIAEAKRRTGLPVVCVMSGNVVQRGDFAVYSKHARAEAAVRCGAGLVVELPAPRSLSAAEGFAEGAVAILAALGCTHISFGSETGDEKALAACAEALSSPTADAAIRSAMEQGVPYGAARQTAADLLCPNAAILKNPNDMLGAEYLCAAEKLGVQLIPVPVKRVGGGHHGADSASAVRRILRSGGDGQDAMPEAAREVFRRETQAGRGPVFLESCETAVLARLRAMGREELERIPGGLEGLGARICAAAGATDLESLYHAVKTKRYHMSRVRRAVLCAYLGITQEDADGSPPYLRVLAFDDTGREILRSAAARGALPVITKPASVKGLGGGAEAAFRLEARVTDLYTLAYPDPACRSGGTEWTAGPVYVRV